MNSKIDNVENENAQESYISPNYNENEGHRIPKWLIEIDEMIISNLERKNQKEPFCYGLQDYIIFFQQKDSGGEMSTFYALIKNAKDETQVFQIEDSCQ